MSDVAERTWDAPHTVEQFTYLHFRWDVAKAWDLVGAQPVTDSIDVEHWAKAMFRAPSAEAMLNPNVIYALSVGVDAKWCVENDMDLDRPVLIVSRELSDGEPVTIMIDGYHRLWKAWYTGVEKLPGILLTPQQERKVRIR